MKNILAITILVLPLSIFAQGPNANINPAIQMKVQEQKSLGNVLGSEENNNSKTTGCKDCDVVKKAIKASYAASGSHHRKSFSMKKRGNKFLERMHMKKIFAHRKKIRTNYEICFTWH